MVIFAVGEPVKLCELHLIVPVYYQADVIAEIGGIYQ